MRDVKYLFNQSSEIINSKSLKVFATFQPFLNDYQSVATACKYLSESEKLKNPEKYHINPLTLKIMAKINLEITSSLCKEERDDTQTPFNESFMTMMSALIFDKEKSIMSGFNRIVDSFKVDGLMQLKKH